jgi:hypothetical protein
MNDKIAFDTVHVWKKRKNMCKLARDDITKK